MCYQHFEDGLDLDIITEGERDLTNVDHWILCGFSCYVLQCVRGLAEKPARPYYKHHEGAPYLHDFYLDLRMGDQQKLTSELYPNHFPKMNITRTLDYGMEELKKIPYYHKEGEDEVELRVQRYIWFYIYIYNLTRPSFMMCNEISFRILRSNFAKLLIDSDDCMSTTSSKL